MATLQTLTQRLARRFEAVSALPADAALLAMMDTFDTFGYVADADVPPADVNKLLAYASAELATLVAINAASYFKYQDGEESVDKSMVAKEYRAIAKLFRDEYQAELDGQAAGTRSTFAVMPRRDRLRGGRL